MLPILNETLPELRHPTVRQELELLDRSVKKLAYFEDDRQLARIPDLQGLGGGSSNWSSDGISWAIRTATGFMGDLTPESDQSRT